MSQAIEKAQEDKTVFGFWIYLMTDCVLFASLFATFIVLRGNTFGGPSGSEIFSMPYVLAETMILLVSSFTCGLGMLAAYNKDKAKTIFWFGATFLLGLAFLAMEIYEFNHLIQEGHSWRASAFLSAFFTLVGTHGLHISIGLGWIAFLIARIRSQGITKINLKRLTLLSLFWHFLDIVWIFIFTIVFLVGEL